MKILDGQVREPAAHAFVRIAKSLAYALMLALSASLAYAQELEFHPPATVSDAATPAVMRDLAERVLPVYQEDDPERYLANLSALQLTSGDYAAAYSTQRSLRERRQNAYPDRLGDREIVSDIYVRARAIEAQDRVPFAQAFTQSFQDVLLRLNNPDAYSLFRRLRTPLSVFQEDLQKTFDERRAKGTIALADAVDLIRTYLTFDAQRNFGPLIDPLAAQDDSRRYITDEDVRITTADGTSITAMLVLPKSSTKALPTLLQLALDVSPQNYAKECAAHGYAGIVAYSRANPTNAIKMGTYQSGGDDARAVINWIAKQPWSNGQVGMYGDNYGAFSEWAAVKHLPPALKAIATSANIAPGINAPMEGSIFRNTAYQWAACLADLKEADKSSCSNEAQWRALDETWYTSGKAYRDLDRVHGRHNRIFQRWLNHPSYDRFWQKMVPFQEEFSHVDIPVLAMSGYYSASEPGSLYYFTQHYQYDPNANHTLLIGPYDDSAIDHRALTTLEGYRVDSAALIDLRELRYQWFDSVLKSGAKPPLLAGHVNYEVMGANEWRHAASLKEMANGSLRFYLDATTSGEPPRLIQHATMDATFVRQTVKLADRSDAAWTASPEIISKNLQLHNAAAFVSAPLPHSIEFNGLFSARLDFTVNKMDVDLYIAMYELLSNGEYLQLFQPAYEFRASYVRDRVHRHLLKAGERQQLTVRSERLMSRKLQAGSRVVMVLGVNKRPDREINYGSGGDVSEESIDAGKVPIKIRWYSNSYIDIPVRR
jgi:putative CocE/NonD family hydrolase